MSRRDLPPFVRQAIPSGPGYVGSRWWNEMLAEKAAGRGRRHALIALGIIGGAAIAHAALSDDDDDDEIESSTEALELQRRTSWNIGGTGRSLIFDGATRTDIDGGSAWQAPLFDGHLDEALRPVDGRLQPYYVPSLFQAPAAASASDLKAALSPISTVATETAFLRGQALATLLKVTDSPSGVGLIIDVPGPEAVAVAAGLADVAAPVFTFANWPHPLGVVSAHLTLASALYYLPLFRRMDVVRPAGAPPAFILDANRLAPYRDEASQFDNRYVASLPSVNSLATLGIQRLLYVRPDGDGLQELDDINEDLSAYHQAGIEVRGLALADFRPTGEEAPARDAGVAATTTAARTMRSHYAWGGGHGSPSYFWSYYGWGRPMPALRTAPPLTVSRASTYRPTPRPTMFSTRTMGGAAGIGKQKPSGFGRVSIRTARATGVVTGVRTGRTGSFGRSRFFSSSG